MDLSKLYFDWIDTPRNIYQNATLFNQNRIAPDQYQDQFLNSSDFIVNENVADFISKGEEENKYWSEKNKKFLKFHRSLNPHTFFNSIPIDHYIGLKTNLATIKNKVVLDVGGGTGHFLSSFFRYPHDIQYFLLDPNVRLLHDQFVRMYPELLEIPIGHLRCYAESLPFKDEVVDVIISSSAIDHYKDYKVFIKESYRCLRQDGLMLISSHLEGARSKKKRSRGIFENIARLSHRIKNRVSLDDHTKEFHSTEEIKEVLLATGFKIQQEEMFKQYFYLLVSK